jgi:hypothetical protein
LIAGDQAFLDEVESLIGERKVPAPLELFRFLNEFVGRRYPGSTFPQATLKRIADVHSKARLLPTFFSVSVTMLKSGGSHHVFSKAPFPRLSTRTPTSADLAANYCRFITRLSVSPAASWSRISISSTAPFISDFRA